MGRGVREIACTRGQTVANNIMSLGRTYDHPRRRASTACEIADV